MKRLVAQVIVLIMLFSISPFEVVLGSDTTTTYQLQLLKDIGVARDEYIADKVVTRAEFSRMAYRLLGYEGTNNVKERFSDVSVDHSEYVCINTLAELGYLNGFSDNRFYPDAPILYEQAVKVMICILGYSSIAEEKGGYPTGYLTEAVDIRLVKGIAISAGNQLTEQQAYRMISNSLEINLLGQNSFGNSPTFNITENTILSSRLKLNKIKGQVTSNGISGIFGDSETGKGYLKIGDMVLDARNVNAFDMLGYNVTAYYNEDYELVSILKNASNTEIILYSQDIVRADIDTIEYSKDISNDITKINIKNASVLLNGDWQKTYTNDIFSFDCGFITAIDTNSDDVYDIIKVTSYSNYFTNKCCSEFIELKYNEPAINLNDYDEIAVYINDEEGNVIDIPENSTISVAVTNNGSRLEVHASTNRVTGIIDEINEDSFITKDGEYKKSIFYKKKFINKYQGFEIKAGNEYVLYLDIYGLVAGIGADEVRLGEARYAYLIAFDTPRGLADKYKVKLLIDVEPYPNGYVGVYEFAKKVSINDKMYTNPLQCDAIYDAINAKSIRQLIIVKFNKEREISSIYTAVNKVDKYIDGVLNPEYAENYTGVCEGEFSLDAIIPENTVWNGGRGNPSQSFGNYPFQVMDKTKLFIVTEDENSDDDDFRIMLGNANINMLGTYFPKMKFYDVDENYTIGAAILVYSDLGNIETINDTTSPIMVIDKVSKGINDEGEFVNVVHGFTGRTTASQGVEKISLFTKDEDLRDRVGKISIDFKNVHIEDLPRGSLIQYATDSSNKLESMRILYIPGMHGDYISRTELGNITSPTTSTSGRFYTAFGDVIKTTNTGFVYNAYFDSTTQIGGVNSSWNRYYMTSDAGKFFNVLLCTDQGLTMMNASEIVSGDKVLIFHRYIVRMVVIYR